ncbi:MAG: polyprenol monophosphomannose synthase [Bacteroidales bacterium]|jgi:dolichol-phosphate mannosyltransferase|nr:polyprenol monophosphomannose synthase [Bacteroidales bacterium]NLK79873.1 polyprenol monophosphomannose synthase [Bacteroidales bacterium]HKM30754.1 polyprenol monophosphomannose synthase [Bacteroidales bacterium]HPX79751.1 polyprenol monophosphomannose synthase [Bacteroidales bacterium]
MQERNLVIIPTYNEKENAEKIIRTVFALDVPFHILIVDDNSPDGTAEIVRSLIPEFTGRLHMIEREGKLGLGTAYLAGFTWGLEQGYDYLIEMDADFSHNPQDLPRLIDACRQGAHVSIGSRYSKGISVINWPIGRVLMSWFASVFVRTILRMPIYDCTAGFICYHRTVLESIDFDWVKMKGYGFQISMKYFAYKLGFTVVEVPIIFIDRTEGTSKMSSGIFGEAFWGVLKLRFKRFPKKQKK